MQKNSSSMTTIEKILNEEKYNTETLVELLGSKDITPILAKAAAVKQKYIGNKVHLRGLIEMTNYCTKNCYYCGIRSANKNVERFMVSDKEMDSAVHFTYNNNYGSIVIQSGELQDDGFIDRIENTLHRINEIGGGKLGVTLSCGEQTIETYSRWRNAGADRYLLRIEASNKDLYYKLHPHNQKHNFETRLGALEDLQKTGYQTGTGVMIGLPFQTLEDLASDLLFMQNFDIDMCGMGPYIECVDTELYRYIDLVPSKEIRLDLSLKMIALLRIMMKDVNIASTTAMQTLVNGGREMALKAGANILMPNVTPGMYREKYSLYNNKPGVDEEAEDSKISIEKLIKRSGCIVAYDEQGNAPHYYQRTI